MKVSEQFLTDPVVVDDCGKLMPVFRIVKMKRPSFLKHRDRKIVGKSRGNSVNSIEGQELKLSLSKATNCVKDVLTGLSLEQAYDLYRIKKSKLPTQFDKIVKLVTSDSAKELIDD